MEFYTKAFFVALAVLVGYGMLLVLQPFAGAMAWAIFLAFLLHPLHRWLTRKMHGKAGVSAGVITGLTPFAVLTPLTLLAFQFVDQARALVHYVRGSDFKLDGSILMRLEQYPGDRPVGAPRSRRADGVSGGHSGLAGARHRNGAEERGVDWQRFGAGRAGHAGGVLLHAVPAVLFPARRHAACSTGCSG